MRLLDTQNGRTSPRLISTHRTCRTTELPLQLTNPQSIQGRSWISPFPLQQHQRLPGQSSSETIYQGMKYLPILTTTATRRDTPTKRDRLEHPQTSRLVITLPRHAQASHAQPWLPCHSHHPLSASVLPLCSWLHVLSDSSHGYHPLQHFEAAWV